MSYMSEVVLYIREAAEVGVILRLEDFRTLDGVLTIGGGPAEEWFEVVAAWDGVAFDEV